jgi:predicted XRE-type DNA-binding protein
MNAKLKVTKGSGNVFKDLGFSEPEAENLKLRSELMIKVESFVEKSGLTQQEAARVLRITQPRLNLLLKGKIEKFSLDALVNMLARAGLRVELRVKKAA